MLFRKGRKYILPLLALICTTIAVSCETEDPGCYEPVVVRVNNSFVVTDTFIQKFYIDPDSTIFIDSVMRNFRDSAMKAPQMITLDEAPPLSVLGIQTGRLSVPLNAAKDSMRYAFRTDTAETAIWDTITFYYTPRVQFISNNCGYTHYFTLNSVKTTYNFFDSVSLPNSNVTNEATVQHVQLYFKNDQ